jgi:dipeptidyl aminopeptidase/acylaminoacyl peptidase
MKRIAVALLLFLSATLSAAERWQPVDRLRLVNLIDPQMSPDGKSVALVLGHANAKDDRYDSEIVVVDVATAAQRALTFDRRGVASPRWSPDGARIAFLANATADRDAKRQVWILPLAGGDARRITDAPKGVQQFAWSPDGSRIAFVTADEAPKTEEKPLSFDT